MALAAPVRCAESPSCGLADRVADLSGLIGVGEARGPASNLIETAHSVASLLSASGYRGVSCSNSEFQDRVRWVHQIGGTT